MLKWKYLLWPLGYLSKLAQEDWYFCRRLYVNTNALRDVMNGPKKNEMNASINTLIQRKFDIVFNRPDGGVKSLAPETNNILEREKSQSDKDNFMNNTTPKKSAPLSVDLNFDATQTGVHLEEVAPKSEVPAPEQKPATKLEIVPEHNDLEFSLDFGEDAIELPALPKVETRSVENTGSDLDEIIDAALLESHNIVSDGTQKTLVYDAKKIAELANFDFEATEEVDKVSLEAKSSIDSFKNEKEDFVLTTELPVENKADLEIDHHFEHEVEPESQNYETSMMPDPAHHDAPENFSDFSMDATGEFDLTAVDFLEDSSPKEVPVVDKIDPYEAKAIPSDDKDIAHSSDHLPEDVRVHATIRQLRLEREELLNHIKNLKANKLELEQDNLTFKAALDESRIEVAILRKRHVFEIEDLKHRLSINEEKRVLAEEKAKMAEAKREKLEQRVRIDFNQVKMREKELETKLEMLTIDVDSQVQSRDQKILELRRKIDALEFNMENISIKEQKSEDDKRRLEDKLKKVMKTLRHSIKNIEDDNEDAPNEAEGVVSNRIHRFGKV